MGRRVEGWGGVNPPQTRPEACLGVVERRLPTNRVKLRLGGGKCLDRSQSLLTQSQCERERSGVRPAQRRGATGHYEKSQPSNAATHHPGLACVRIVEPISPEKLVQATYA